MLSKYEALHLFPVPSTMAASMRQALYPSGAKDDPRDADLLLDLLLQHRDKINAYRIGTLKNTPLDEAPRRKVNKLESGYEIVLDNSSALG
jgi:hypothetical protein